MKHLKHLKHALATWGSMGPDDSSRWGRSWCCTSTTTTTIASSAGLGSAKRTVCVTSGSEWCGMGGSERREMYMWQ